MSVNFFLLFDLKHVEINPVLFEINLKFSKLPNLKMYLSIFHYGLQFSVWGLSEIRIVAYVTTKRIIQNNSTHYGMKV